MSETRCPVCLEPRVKIPIRTVPAGSWQAAKCGRCGDFQFDADCWIPFADDSPSSLFGPLGSRPRANASGYIREHQNIRIGVEDVKWLATRKTPSFHERADKLLQALERETKFAGDPVNVDEPKWRALASCVDQEFGEVLIYLVSTQRVRWTHEKQQGPVAIAPNGWAHLETLRERGAATSQGFIAMHMDDSLDPLWHHGLEAGIDAAGYGPFRIDKKLDADKLDDEILAEIRRSKFLVADLTHQRKSVYLEIGFAMGLGMPVFRTCREDDIQNLHFDQKTYHCTAWAQGKEDELVQSLRDRIVAKVHWGSLKSSERQATFAGDDG